MDLYQAGTEFPVYRRLLIAEGHLKHSLSYWALRKRNKFTKPFDINAYYNDPAVQILIDSGTYSLNHNPASAPTADELADIADHYYDEFIQPNLSRIDFFVEFDAARLDADHRMKRLPWLEEHRAKAVFVWHPGQDLDEICENWPNVAIPKDAIDNNLAHRLARIVRSTGVRLFGLGITKPDLLQTAPFHAVTSTSWLSPSQFGDTIWFSGGELRRYPKKMKDRARKRHRQEFVDAGYDIDLIDQDDPTEVLRLSIYAWSRYMEKLNASIRGVTPTTPNTTEPNVDFASNTVDTQSLQERHQGVTTVAPWHRPDNPTIRTKEQLADAEATVLELQLGRVYKRARAEESYGENELDPVLSEEIDRWSKLAASKRKADEASVSISIKATQKGAAETGLISRLFGAQETPHHALPATPSEAAEQNIVDADVIED
ncbi:hypothetical protein ADL22_12160 [Streptomyces sp. NRRL F-4489]|uniref:hypothetical protein n=1 Tax=Streptomyces sp. NRRL F-4489 TaxID=1609095 RepID=UPI0007482B57|nr:hypothetical protein [Streptomyces sp. NRRL F-4489]KUL44692.1 hypothetical protein ADL22_12160 [Streptomyces sp. NRRL F-4489]